MTEITSQLFTALADKYAIERELGEGGAHYLAEGSDSFLPQEQQR